MEKKARLITASDLVRLDEETQMKEQRKRKLDREMLLEDKIRVYLNGVTSGSHFTFPIEFSLYCQSPKGIGMTITHQEVRPILQRVLKEFDDDKYTLFISTESHNCCDCKCEAQKYCGHAGTMFINFKQNEISNDEEDEEEEEENEEEEDEDE
jgi:hypothetical protein